VLYLPTISSSTHVVFTAVLGVRWSFAYCRNTSAIFWHVALSPHNHLTPLSIVGEIPWRINIWPIKTKLPYQLLTETKFPLSLSSNINLSPEQQVTDSCAICCVLLLPTSTALYWKISACLTQNLLCSKEYLLHIPQTEICHIYYTSTADLNLFLWFRNKGFAIPTPISPYDAICWGFQVGI
jgi:hypothetical protein